ncbi:MAG: 30S ribosomal protein S4 [Chloroflexi bacterium]|nr:30S ribosomal protein S4 [Chloroflexota bacterium]
MDVRGPKDRLSRRFGINLTGTTSRSLDRRLAQPPGVHGAKRRRKPSQYGEQLLEKQKVRAIYGVKERQFSRYFAEASRVAGRPGENLMQLLEVRLDHAVYRAGFARTRPMARQFVSHRHITINGQIASIPSMRVKPGDVIGLANGVAEIPGVAELLRHPVTTAPVWLSREGTSSRVLGLPAPTDYDAHVNVGLIVEFYSR